MLALVVSLAAAQLTFCAPGELLVLGCPVKKKLLAVCAGPAEKPAWVQYRFGPPGKPELTFPPTPAGTAPFRYEHRDLVSGTSHTLTFENGGNTYEIWNTEGRDAGAGVNIEKDGKRLASVTCTGDFDQNWEFIDPLFAGPQPPPDPLAGKSPREICDDDALLLINQTWEDLVAGGFQRTCCVKGALEGDDRCHVDWPTSDVSACRDLDLLRNRLFALYGYTFKDAKYRAAFAKEPWYRARPDFDAGWMPEPARRNAARLKELVTKQQGCVPDSEVGASKDACARAAKRYSLDAFARAKGQMDGMQQSEIHEAAEAQCAAGWSAAAADCFAGAGKDCEARLTPAQRKALVDRVKEIAPE